MNCSEFKSAIECAIEQRTQVDPDALEHISSCAECQRNWKLQQRVDEAIFAWRACRPPVPPVEAVLANLTWPLIDQELEPADVQGSVTFSDQFLSVSMAGGEDFSRTRARSQFLAIASCVACLLSILVFGLNRFQANVIPQGEELSQASQNGNSQLASANTSDDLTTELSNLVGDLRTQLSVRGTEPAESSINVTDNNLANEHVSTDHNSKPNKIEKRVISQVIEQGNHPLLGRLKRGFGFLSQSF